MIRPSIMLLSAVLLAGASSDRASAQTSPETQSCGGLLCDIGIFGHKVPAAPVAPPAPVAPVTQAQTAAAQPPAMPAAIVEPPHKTVKKKAAKIATAKPPAAQKPVTKAPIVKAPIMKASAPATPRAVTATPAQTTGVDGADAEPRPPSPADMFRPIY